MKRALVLVALLGLGACARSTAPRPTDDDAARARHRWPGTTTADLTRGRSLYIGHCGSCHLPPTPSDYSVDEWPGHVQEMGERAGLTPDGEELVRRYVVTMAMPTQP